MEGIKGVILLAEDDQALAYVIKDSLEEEGYIVIHCADGQEAMDKFNKSAIDLCILDIMMPHKDGFTVAKKIRQHSDVVPIIFLSTKTQLEDRLKGYETGADDYLSKPFHIGELLKKIEVFLRRTKKISSDKKEEFMLGNLKFDFTELKITTVDTIFNVTQKEGDLLKFFAMNANKLLKREEVLINVWGKDDFFLGRSMDVYVTRLRKYLKAEPSIMLETIHGIGFRFFVP